jgi:hypothetical protein
MDSFKRIFLLFSVLFLTQCEHVENLTDTGFGNENTVAESNQMMGSNMADTSNLSPFQASLNREYADLAEHMYYLGEKYSAKKFSKKADAVLENERLEPSKVSTFKIIDGSASQLKEARIRLIQALVIGGRERTPQYAARAQSSFDCWVEHSDEVSPLSKSCKSRYLNSIEHIEARLKECVPDLLPQSERPVAPQSTSSSQSDDDEIFKIIY